MRLHLVLTVFVSWSCAEGPPASEPPSTTTSPAREETPPERATLEAEVPPTPPDVAAPGHLPAPPRLPPAALERVERCPLPLEPPPASIEVHEAVPFRTVGGDPVLLYLAKPRAPGPHPVVVLVHGGAWRRGERVHLATTSRILAGRGFVAASLDYRLAPDHPFPAAVSDVRCAVRYLAAHADDLDLDPSRIGGVGFSSGAHLVGMAAAAPSDPSLDDVACDVGVPVRLALWVGYFGLYDLRLDPSDSLGPWPRPTARSVEGFLPVGEEAFAEVAAAASPLLRVDARTAPALLIHGTEDRVVPISQSRAMTSALDAAGVQAHLMVLDGEDHGFTLSSRRPEIRPSVCTALAFLERGLAPGQDAASGADSEPASTRGVTP